MDNIGGIIGGIIGLAVAIFYIFCAWRIFEKAGQPGWMAIIPILNIFILIQIAGKDWWWIILFFIPIVNFIAVIMVWHGVSENFGHGIGFTLGLIFLGPIFIPILALGNSQYQGGRKSYA